MRKRWGAGVWGGIKLWYWGWFNAITLCMQKKTNMKRLVTVVISVTVWKLQSGGKTEKVGLNVLRDSRRQNISYVCFQIEPRRRRRSGRDVAHKHREEGGNQVAASCFFQWQFPQPPATWIWQRRLNESTTLPETNETWVKSFRQVICNYLSFVSELPEL